MTKTYIRSLILAGLLALSTPILLFGQASPCYGNPQAGWTGVCHYTDTVTITGSTCPTCVYNWGGNPLNGNGNSEGKYLFPATNPYPHVVEWQGVSMSYYDPNLSCTGTGYWHWDIGVPGTTQMTAPVLLNGPYDGDTSKTWIYLRNHNENLTSVSVSGGALNWSYSRNYSLVGGTILSTSMDQSANWNGDINDTIWVKWYNTASREINCSGSLGMDGFNLSMQVSCSNYVEELAPEPLNDAYPIGQDTPCIGDTAIYYTTPVPTATYSWLVSGGTILSGQGTDQVEVEWTTLPGSITVSRLYNSSTSSNTLNVSPPLLPSFSLGNDTILCSGTSLTLTAPSASSYSWSTAAATQSIAVNDSGNYWVTIPATYCSNAINISDTIRIDTVQPVNPNLGADLTICPGTSTTFDAGASFQSYNWSTNNATQTITATGTGDYSVTTTDLNGCLAADTVNISHFTTTSPDLGPDTLVCPGDSFTFDAGPGFLSYLWPDNSTAQTFTAPPPGPIFVEVTDGNACITYDTVQLSIFSGSQPNLGNDTSFCVGATITLDPGAGYTNYTWSTGDTTSTITTSFPGPYEVFTIDTNNCIGFDSIFISNYPVIPVILGADSFLCADTSVVLDAGPDFSSYLWNTGDPTQTITVGSGMLYFVDAVDSNGCSSTDSLNLLDLADCVFPGDLDYDGVANNNDVLALGVAYGQIGPIRAGANLQWYGQRTSDWSSNLPTGPNMKHCDSDGNGLANDNDTLAISLNYGFTHNKADVTQATAPQLQIVADFDSVQAGDTAVYNVFLGDSLTPADSVYGIAFTVNYDTTLVDTNGLFFADYSNSWIAPQSQLLTFTKDLYPVPKADLAVVRTSSPDTSGYGVLCRLGFVTIDNISGKKDLLAKTLHISLTDIRFINHEMMQLAISGSVDSTVVYQEELSASFTPENRRLDVFPLPAEDHFGFHLNGESIGEWELRNLEGKVVVFGNAEQRKKVVVDTRVLANGMYFLRVYTENRRPFVEKVPVMR